MERKIFLLKVIKCMKGFATAKEIKEEYDYLCSNCDNPQKEMIGNITYWLRWNINESDKQFVIWERLRKENLICEENSNETENEGEATDRQIMFHRFCHKNIKKGTGVLCKELGLTKKEYDDAVRRAMEKEEC